MNLLYQFSMMLTSLLFCVEKKQHSLAFRHLSHNNKWRTFRSSTTSTKSRSTTGNDEFFLDNLEKLLEDNQAMKGKILDVRSTSPLSHWRTIDWKPKYESYCVSQNGTTLNPTPVERVLVRNRLVYFKRDDDRKPSTGAPINGNKARKMKALNDLHPNEFPACLVSYGGPQSNSMLALAAIVHFKNQQQQEITPNRPPKRFVYYTKKLPRFLREQPNGNLFRAQTLGMEMVEVSHEKYKNFFGSDWGGPTEPPPSLTPPIPGDTLWVPQGGACHMARIGAHELAVEIADYWSRYGQGRPLTVFFPGGTCSTALLTSVSLHQLLLQHHPPSYGMMDIQVAVIPCVGDQKYAHRQMLSLYQSLGESDKVQTNVDDVLPRIVPPCPETTTYFGQSSSSSSNSKKGYFSFGEPEEEILSTFRELKDDCGIPLDLVYGSPAWTVLLRHFRSSSSSSISDLLVGRELMYVHSGGLEGINSQLMRYKYKGLIDEVQLPGKQR